MMPTDFCLLAGRNLSASFYMSVNEHRKTAGFEVALMHHKNYDIMNAGALTELLRNSAMRKEIDEGEDVKRNVS